MEHQCLRAAVAQETLAREVPLKVSLMEFNRFRSFPVFNFWKQILQKSHQAKEYFLGESLTLDLRTNKMNSFTAVSNGMKQSNVLLIHHFQQNNEMK